MPAGGAKLFTWHSARIFLACALSAAKVDDNKIQMMLRWQTKESLRVYARMGMADYGALLERAGNANVSSVQTANLPLMEQFDLFLALHRALEE